MKHIILSFLLLSALVTKAQQTPEVAAPAPTTPASPKAQLVFKEATHDFGEIKAGDVVSYNYEFTNAGQAPLIISNVQTTCGCTASDWSRSPVPAGKTGQIKLTFNSKGKVGRQNKVVTIYSNALNPEERVTLSATVLPADQQPATPGQEVKIDGANPN